MRPTSFLFYCLLFWIGSPLANAQAELPGILPLRDRATLTDALLEDRMDNLLPALMRREGIDMWVIISREYNEDPVMKTMLPASWLSARRRTIFVFFDPGNGQSIEKVAIARYDVGRLLKGIWAVDVQPDQWLALVELIEARKPQKIGLNYSQHFALADGLVHSEYETLMAKLPPAYRQRVVSAERLAIAWLETRTDKELAIYPMICRLGHQILQEGLSEKAIHPGITTTEDVVWWLRQRVNALGLDDWFQPSVSIERADPGSKEHLRSFALRPTDAVILPGDLLHVDFGITYLQLNTDQQQHFYVLRPGETEVPAYLQAAFRKGNRVQDILTSQFRSGRTGNEILAATLAQAAAEGIDASIYTHPIGLHGHAAGPTIGLWDQQQGVPGNGDYPLLPNTAYSIELYAASYIPEWGKIVRIRLEEDGVFTGSDFYYLDGRQTEILPIPRHPATAAAASSRTANVQPLTAMTYNVRFASPNDGDNTWDKRRDELAQLVQHYRPAVMGTQEGLHHQLLDMDARLPQYARIGVGRADGKTDGEYAAIYYDTTRLTALTSATFWLSESQDTASVGWDAAMERVATYGLFYDRAQHRHLWVMNAHFDHIGVQARTQSARLLLEKLAVVNTQQFPVIVMGDFNSEPDTDAIRLLDAQLDDALARSPQPLYGPVGTFTGFDKALIPNRRIDYIFTKGFGVQHYRHIDDRRRDGFFVSDHLPVVAELTW